MPLTQSKTETVLDLFSIRPGDQVFFHTQVDEPDEPRYSVSLPVDVWADMGEPQQVTVTVRPGGIVADVVADAPTVQPIELPAGWGWPGSARKAHWFDDGQATSLCGRWMFTGHRTPGPGSQSNDDCSACWKKLPV